MNQTLSIMAHETRLMWKEFRLSTKRPLTRILITVVIGAVVIVNIGLEATLFMLFDASPALGEALLSSLAQSGLTSYVISDIVYFLLLVFLISSFVRGIVSSDFGLLFTRSDENIIVPSPVASHALYAAKRFRRFVHHALTVATVLVAGFPFFNRIGFEGPLIVVIFIALLALMEICGFIQNISYCISRELFRRSTSFNKSALVAFIALAAFVVACPVLTVLGGNSSWVLTYLYPPSAFTTIVTLPTSPQITPGVFFLSGEAILFFFVASATAQFGLRAWGSSPKLVQTRTNFIRLRKNRLMWKTKKKSAVRLMLMKDFWITLRNPSKFFVPMTISLVLLLFAIVLQSISPFNTQQLLMLQSTELFFVLSIYFVTVFVLSPAWDSFAGERHTLFILKSSPVTTSTIIWSKYLFALLQSVSYTIPLVAAVSLLLPHALDIFIMFIEVTLVLAVSNAVGILASVSYPPAYRGMGPPPYLILLGLPILCIALTLIIPISLLFLYRFTTVLGAILALTAFYILHVSRIRMRAAFFIIAVSLLLFFRLTTFFDFAFASALYYGFIVVSSCIRKAEKSFAGLEGSWDSH